MSHAPTVETQSNFQLLLADCSFLNWFAGCLVQRTGWTKDIDVFLQWLSNMPFLGGGFNEAAIAEGLSEALMV